MNWALRGPGGELEWGEQTPEALYEALVGVFHGAALVMDPYRDQRLLPGALGPLLRELERALVRRRGEVEGALFALGARQGWEEARLAQALRADPLFNHLEALRELCAWAIAEDRALVLEGS